MITLKTVSTISELYDFVKNAYKFCQESDAEVVTTKSFDTFVNDYFEHSPTKLSSKEVFLLSLLIHRAHCSGDTYAAIGDGYNDFVITLAAMDAIRSPKETWNDFTIDIETGAIVKTGVNTLAN